MKSVLKSRHQLIPAIALALAATLLGGCATIDGAHTIATPWGAGGLYSFKDNAREQPSAHKVDAQVAKVLDSVEQTEHASSDVRVVSR